MGFRRLLLLIAVTAAGLFGVLAARHRQVPDAAAAAPMAAQGLAVFLDDSGNKVQPTAAQLKGLAPSGTQAGKRPAPKVVATDPNNPAMGVTLENPPLLTTVARVRPDGTVDAGCFEDEAQADAFKGTASAEVAQ